MTTRTATDPARSCSVLASAGTGKTWQLVARLTRLLLAGASLDSILAITFTRKAAGEMQQRLGERLRELLEADDQQLDALLEEIGATPTPELRLRARGLFEASLRNEQRLRANTFHSFCQDLLQHFPLEAGLPPGFDLLEQTGLLVDEAWDALFAEATAAPQQPPAEALTQLFDTLNGLYSTRQALLTVVAHRSDWWAYTQHSRKPVEEAVEWLEKRLAIDEESAAGTALWNADSRAALADFLELLQKHDTKGNRQHAEQLANLLARHDTLPAEVAIDRLYPLFFTGSDTPRKRKSSKAQQKSMGAEGEAHFLQLHDHFCERLEAWREHRNRQRTLAINRAWYLAGARLLAHYQRIKRERRLLDFADLEWHAYRLLNHPEHAHWIQYKLDQRIDHLLIDEFQDTNPTQWRLILPLLEEIAAGGERQRSLFIVGDAKQSIYRFRRGNPRLLGCAADWMQQKLNAGRVHLDYSRRSSPVIMDCINTLFQHPDMQGLLEDFQPHDTHCKDYWGRVELWPLVAAEPQPTDDSVTETLRNPLQQPRPSASDHRHYREGEAIATRIRQLVDQRIATYSDIMILMRSRTHLADYEAALRARHIPYLSLDRGTLLQSLEIRDLEALLQVLITPRDNLSLAQVLRSPLFSLNNDALAQLAAGQHGSWYERLQTTAADLVDPQLPLVRAARLLAGWHALAGHIPIHDLLQQIFHQANVVARFQAAFPASQMARVSANLTRFIELALEVDAGRYPTLPRFLERLQQLRCLDKEGPNQATPTSQDSRRVRLLTIHAAKGLEAPVVFLADSAHSGHHQGRQILVRWPAEADRPSDFMLLSNRQQRDSLSRQGYELEQQEEQREAANLLYVALTRARHMLVISGCSSNKRSSTPDGYRQLATALCGDEALAEVWGKSYLEPPVRTPDGAQPEPAEVLDPRLCAPVEVTPTWHEIAPSRHTLNQLQERGDADGTLRGQVIHRLLQLGTDHPDPLALQQELLHQTAREYRLDSGDERLRAWWQEVVAILKDERLAWLMRIGPGWQGYNEIPIQYRQDQHNVYGIIDRLVVAPDRVYLVDYKSHRLHAASEAGQLVERYRPQMSLYREGVQRLWPQQPVVSYLLLTHGAHLIKLDD